MIIMNNNEYHDRINLYIYMYICILYLYLHLYHIYSSICTISTSKTGSGILCELKPRIDRPGSCEVIEQYSSLYSQKITYIYSLVHVDT